MQQYKMADISTTEDRYDRRWRLMNFRTVDLIDLTAITVKHRIMHYTKMCLLIDNDHVLGQR